MAVSQNGWSANDPTTVSRRTVPGSQVGLTVRNGPAGDLLLAVAALFDQLVQDIDNARGALDDWGYAERPIRGSTETSNHASGTAIDLNATRWALGATASVNLTPAQIATTRAIVAATGGAVRWGADYSGRKDPMHFEVADGRTAAQCAAALEALHRAFPTSTSPGRAPASHGKDEPVSAIPLNPGPDGKFRVAVNTASDLFDEKITVSSTWGPSAFTVTALDGRGGVTPLSKPNEGVANNLSAEWPLPASTRIVTIEGKTSGVPTAALVSKAK